MYKELVFVRNWFEAVALIHRAHAQDQNGYKNVKCQFSDIYLSSDEWIIILLATLSELSFPEESWKLVLHLHFRNLCTLRLVHMMQFVEYNPV